MKIYKFYFILPFYNDVKFIHHKHIGKVDVAYLYSNFGKSEQNCTPTVPSIDCFRNH